MLSSVDPITRIRFLIGSGRVANTTRYKLPSKHSTSLRTPGRILSQSSSLAAMLLSSPLPSLRPPTSRRISAVACRGASDSIRLSLPATRNAHPLNLDSSMENSGAVLHHSQFSAPVQLPGNLGLRRDPELGLVSLLFVFSMAIGSFISVALISLPALNAFRKLAISMDKLSKVVSEEIPGTLSSLKLSGLEINDLTCQLKYLRQRISGNQSGKKVRANKPRSREGRSDSIIN